jgi:hypothetical protein
MRKSRRAIAVGSNREQSRSATRDDAPLVGVPRLDRHAYVRGADVYEPVADRHHLDRIEQGHHVEGLRHMLEDSPRSPHPLARPAPVQYDPESTQEILATVTRLT